MTPTPEAASASRRSRLPRLLRRLVLVVLVLVLVFFAGGGWYFSGRIRAEGLEVKDYPVENHLRLYPSSGGTVGIRSSAADETKMLAAPSTYGVKWAGGGYGRVSGPWSRTADGRIVRHFEVVRGTAPAQGTRASTDLVAFPEDPEVALGPQVRAVSYTSPRGRFPAWFVPGTKPGSTTWAILVHGKGGSRTEMYRMTRATAAAGLPSLDITYRNDDGLPRDTSGYYQYGRTEWRDLQGAVDYAAAHGAGRVVLGADSMGGSIVASYLRHRDSGTSGPVVAGLVLDAPMLDFAKTVQFGARQLELPVLGHVPDSLTWTAERIASARYDLDWDSIDYLDDTSWLKVPTLLFHGTADTTVPISTSRELAKDKPGLVTLVATKGVEHVRSWNADPPAYDERVRQLVDRVER
jgi:pimeloyl-ACP methyl ester carboxylesterase